MPRASRDPRRPHDAGLPAAGALAGEYVEDLLLGTVRDVHQAWADRAFALTGRATGGASRLPQRLHDRISWGVYAGVGGGLRATAAGLRAVERRGLGPRLQERPAGRHVLSAVNGLVGDRLRDDRPELAIDLAVRHRGADVPTTQEALSATFPGASGHLAVFLHGLGENDESWNRRRDEHGGTYGSRLAGETGWTPVYLRANTGLPIAENGVAPVSLLHRLVDAWPTEVRRIALVGHSMGGLIMRAVCAVDTEALGPAPWTDRVTHVVTLGTPHLGAPWSGSSTPGRERWGCCASRRRSAASWSTAASASWTCGVGSRETCRTSCTPATTSSRRRWPGRTGTRSARRSATCSCATPRQWAGPGGGSAMFPDAEVLHVPGADHFALLNHPDVYDALRTWLG